MNDDAPDWADKPDWATDSEAPAPAPVAAQPTPQALERKVKPVADLRSQLNNTGGDANTPISMAGREAAPALLGLGQYGLKSLIGAVAAPVAGIIGAGDVAKNILQGKSFDESVSAGADVSKGIQGAAEKVGNLVPQNTQAKNIASNVGSVMEDARTKMSQGAQYANKAFGSPVSNEAAGAMGEVSPDVISTLLGAKPMLEAGRAVSAVKPRPLTQPQDAIVRAKANGYAASPQEAHPTMTNKVMTTVANADKLNDEIAKGNAENTTRLVKEDLGLHPDQFLNEATLAPLKAEAEKKYAAIQAIKNVDLTPDAKLVADLGPAGHPNADVIATQPEYYRTPGYQAIKAEILSPAQPWTTTTVMKHIAELRNDANKLAKKAGVSRAEERDAQAMKNVANSMEDFLERKLTQDVYTGGEATAARPGPQGILPGKPPAPQLAGRTAVAPYSDVGRTQIPPAPGAAPGGPIPMGQNVPKSGGVMSHADNAGRARLIADWQQARQKLAKIHDVEDSANLETGHVDPAKLKRIEDNGGKLTGRLADIVQAHKAMPHVVKSIEKGSQASLRAGDNAVGGAVVKAAHTLTGAGLGASAGGAFGPVGAAAGAGIGLATPLITRKLMASGLYQKYMAHPSPAILDQIRAIDPKTAAALTAASASRTTTPLPAPMEAPK